MYYHYSVQGETAQDVNKSHRIDRLVPDKRPDVELKADNLAMSFLVTIHLFSNVALTAGVFGGYRK
jgi:hypothetical protein